MTDRFLRCSRHSPSKLISFGSFPDDSCVSKRQRHLTLRAAVVSSHPKSVRLSLTQAPKQNMRLFGMCRAFAIIAVTPATVLPPHGGGPADASTARQAAQHAPPGLRAPSRPCDSVCVPRRLALPPRAERTTPAPTDTPAAGHAATASASSTGAQRAAPRRARVATHRPPACLNCAQTPRNAAHPSNIRPCSLPLTGQQAQPIRRESVNGPANVGTFQLMSAFLSLRGWPVFGS